jgi:hypothetical protein
VGEQWVPPDFAGQRRTRIGASVVEQFVSGHDASDVLRELVQNEFDGQGDKLFVTFGESALEVIGNGKGVTKDGWTRLSVIVGTGRVVGDVPGERVAAKANGIGSKNFGLRSLFIFGDEIYVRSGGQVCVLDLRTLETGRVLDRDYWNGPGVRLQVPFRRETFEMMEPFTVEREAVAFEVMAKGMLSTLVKLALPGARAGLRQVSLRSTRIGRSLDWKQKAEAVRSNMKGVSMTSRAGKLVDVAAGARTSRAFEEMEFIKSVEVPSEYADRNIPAYFQVRGAAVRIAVSLATSKGKVDVGAEGHFHYPLQAPDARTGCAVSVSGPFILDNDRSGLIDHGWNTWLMEQAARFTVDLLVGDWADRFGVGVIEALSDNGHGTPKTFLETVHRLLKSEPCWPTRASGSARFTIAEKCVVVSDPLLDGFLGESSYLAREASDNTKIRSLALASGATPFNLKSLIRLRCAGDDTSDLETSMKRSEDGDWRFTDYETALKEVDRQVAMATSLTALSRNLSVANRNDLKNTISTLSAVGELKAAIDLVVVPTEIWEICPEPMANRLHPSLTPHKAIAGFCRVFDEQVWMRDAAARASLGTIAPDELSALYARILDKDARIGKLALQAIRVAPVCRSSKGDWVVPDRMTMFKGRLAKLMAAVSHAPSKEMLAVEGLTDRLRIRERLIGEDLLACARSIGDRPSAAPQFEGLLMENLRLLGPSVRDQLQSIPFLLNRAGGLSAPEDLHLDTALNRMIVGDEAAIVAGQNDLLYRKLEVAEFPAVETLLAVLSDHRSRSERPPHPEKIYPALVAGLRREGRPKGALRDEPIVWHRGGYHNPSDVLVGATVPPVLADVLPVVRRTDETSMAYVSLGARTAPSDEDWRRFFTELCDDWDRKVVSGKMAQLLTSAYWVRGSEGLPDEIEDLECLLTRGGLLYSMDELREGKLVENDFPALADALARANIQIGIVDITDRNRSFFHKLGLRHLSEYAGTGHAVFGEPVRAPAWFRPHHTEQILDLLERPLFARALESIVYRRRYMFEGAQLVSREALTGRLAGVKAVTFFDIISRRYEIQGAEAGVVVEAGIGDDFIGLVAPRSRLDFQQLVSQALAEMAGATNANLARTLASDILPLVLCRSTTDILVQLERVGIDPRNWEVEPELDFAEDDIDDTGEDALRQMMGSLNTAPDHDPAPHVPVHQPAVSPTIAPAAPTIAIATYSPSPLPALENVTLTVSETKGEKIEAPEWRSGGGGYGGWSPRTGAEVERDRELGERGEALVYQMELERVRKAGHPDPESVVIWTSRTDPGADHDICSQDENGDPRWIEVKSTSGMDGQFDWSRKEFEKAVRERERYELWRVYRANTTEPIAKCFPNPGKLIGISRIRLELGTIRANVEAAD